MKIGILTIQKSPSSYGANLQCFALWKYITSLGYSCDVIDLLRPCHKNYKNYKNILSNSSLSDNISIVSYLKNELLHSVFKKRFYRQPNESFFSFWNIISYSEPYNLRKLYLNKNIYDIYITGSDQVWNPTQDYKIEPYFLSFTKKKKISYAASMGIREIPNKMGKIVRQWLNEYEFISVREEDAKECLSSIIEKEIEVVVDPTFLLQKEEWKSIFIHDYSCDLPQEDYILFYSLSYNNDFIKMLSEFKKHTEYKVYVIDYNLIDEEEDFCVINNIGPLDFLALIYHSKYVITDSFHCMAFAINFDISFSVIRCDANRSRISRMESILRECDSLDKIVDVDVFDKDKMCFDHFNKEKINSLIAKSKSWLKSSLEVCSGSFV